MGVGRMCAKKCIHMWVNVKMIKFFKKEKKWILYSLPLLNVYLLINSFWKFLSKLFIPEKNYWCNWREYRYLPKKVKKKRDRFKVCLNVQFD
jgi:hypothetical protein